MAFGLGGPTTSAGISVAPNEIMGVKMSNSEGASPSLLATLIGYHEPIAAEARQSNN